MSNFHDEEKPCECDLDTLAKRETSSTTHVVVNGFGSKVVNEDMIKRRAKKKAITQCLVVNLIKVAEQKQDNCMIRSYWNTYHCQNKLISIGRTLYGRYCKNRFCKICSGIRKAELIIKYKPIIETWPDAFFVTLTVRSVKAGQLSNRMDEMQKALCSIVAKYRKRNTRGTGQILTGIYAMECNFNSKKRTYNPHFHLIVSGEHSYTTLMREWWLWWKGEASKAGMHTKRVLDVEKHLIENIKYCGKIFTEPDPNKKSKKNRNRFVYAVALHNILCAMKGRKIFGHFGFKLTNKKTTDKKSTHATKYKQWLYDPSIYDWQNENADERLSGFKMGQELDNLLTNNVDLELE